jgi:phosphotransferase system HPr (HPr) family protein
MSPSSDVIVAARLPQHVPLHARPAGRFVRAAASFPCAVTVAANGKRANAKSILEVIGLGATGGTELELSASGDRAAEAVEHLAALVRELD